jgi:DNA-binding transcriptional LysR family regulator
MTPQENKRAARIAGRIADTDIRLLKIFKAVVECGGFTNAQVDLNISRAAISIAMSDLEHRLSLKLCRRGRSGFSMTDQGNEVYHATLALFSALENFRTQVNIIHQQLKGELNIGITDTLVTMPRMKITKALSGLKQRGPEVKVNIRMIPPADIEMGVLDGKLHTGVIPVSKILPGLDYISLYNEQSHLYCCHNHPLFAQHPLSVERIEQYEAVLPAYAQSASIKTLYQHLKGTATATDREGIAFLILTGHYIGYLPIHFAERWVAKGKLRALLPEELHFETPIAAISRKGAMTNLVLNCYLQQLDPIKKPVD